MNPSIDAADAQATNANPADLRGDLALPRANGELVFAQPWQARAFGIAVALNESGAYPWRDFHASLAREIAAQGSGEAADQYYARWLTALETLLTERGILSHAEIAARASQCAAANAHDDHHDDHNHDSHHHH